MLKSEFKNPEKIIFKDFFSSTSKIQNMKTKFIFILIVLAVLNSCNKRNNTVVPTKKPTDTTTTESYFNSDTIFVSKGHSFQVLTIDPDFKNSDTLLVLVKRDSLAIFKTYTNKNGLNNQEFIDFNNDGFFDILFSRGDQRGPHELYLYDSLKNTFVKSSGFERISEYVRLKSNSNYWYSYSRAGCADMNWTSKLFTFKNFETVELGYIYGKGCDDEEPQSIQISRVINNDENDLKLIKNLPYSVLNDTDKWSFIEEYWNKNYQKFK
ncbi:hypothetical protein [Flavobacterium foetidum]|uniref:hypothetical protein n=1 Tax=Flavobacterium foetidum TaxID=2026681 RepID=UPI0013C304DB|nr:hypothetical protein [Flavobacterium foetidum]KAF2509120.1 hypothetical protein E0W73_19120 [Flavobacterium foetidum]